MPFRSMRSRAPLRLVSAARLPLHARAPDLRSLAAGASLACALLSGAACAAELLPKAFGAGATLSIDYRRDTLDVRVKEMPLKRIMDELARQTGMHMEVIDPAIAAWPVSVRAEGVSLQQAIMNILDGFSYALAGPHAVIVLSTPPRPRRAGGAITGALRSAADALTGHPAAHIPQTLEEFRPSHSEVETPDLQGDVFAHLNPQTDPASPREDEHRQALLQRALDALQTEHQHLHAQAIDELASLHDPSAAAALIDAATRGQLRYQAVEALGRYAASFQDADGASLAALQRLAQDPDPAVSRLAKQFLEQLHRQELSRTEP